MLNLKSMDHGFGVADELGNDGPLLSLNTQVFAL